MRVGVFDSGIGGITVLSEISKRLGAVDYVYLGDTAHVPYGTKSPTQVVRLSVACAHILKEKKIDILVVACNTASSLALESIVKTMSPIPVIGMVEPGVEAVLGAMAGHQERAIQVPLLVLATRATVRSGIYGNILRQRLATTRGPQGDFSRLSNPDSPRVIEQACPLLVPMIEEGWIDHSILYSTLEVYIGPHRVHSLGVPGVALLGCTHYPWIKPAIQLALPGWTIVDSAHAVASALERSALIVNEGRRPQAQGRIEWIFTDPDAVPAFATQLIQSMNSEGI